MALYPCVVRGCPEFVRIEAVNPAAGHYQFFCDRHLRAEWTEALNLSAELDGIVRAGIVEVKTNFDELSADIEKKVLPDAGLGAQQRAHLESMRQAAVTTPKRTALDAEEKERFRADIKRMMTEGTKRKTACRLHRKRYGISLSTALRYTDQLK